MHRTDWCRRRCPAQWRQRQGELGCAAAECVCWPNKQLSSAPVSLPGQMIIRSLELQQAEYKRRRVCEMQLLHRSALLLLHVGFIGPHAPLEISAGPAYLSSRISSATSARADMLKRSAPSE